MARRMISNAILLVLTMAIAVSCSRGGTAMSPTESMDSSVRLESYSKNGNFRMSLTDAPSKDLKAVFVNIASAEIWVSKGDKTARVQLAKDLGMVDLMTLRNGKLMTLQDINLPEGATVTQIRLILGSGNYSVKSDDSQCAMQTPSAQQSGIKIHLTNAVTIESGKSYSMVVDFDAEKSVVIKGNGDCLLKPVLKIASFTKIDSDVVGGGDSGNGGDQPPVTGGDDVTGGTSDSNDDSSNGDDGYDDSDESGYPPIVDPDLIGSHLQ